MLINVISILTKQANIILHIIFARFKVVYNAVLEKTVSNKQF